MAVGQLPVGYLACLVLAALSAPAAAMVAVSRDEITSIITFLTRGKPLVTQKLQNDDEKCLAVDPTLAGHHR